MTDEIAVVDDNRSTRNGHKTTDIRRLQLIGPFTKNKMNECKKRTW